MTDRLGTAATVPFLALVTILAGVGGIAVVAEWRGDWESYFLMEQAVSGATPVVAALAAVAIVSGFVVVYRAT